MPFAISRTRIRATALALLTALGFTAPTQADLFRKRGETLYLEEQNQPAQPAPRKPSFFRKVFDATPREKATGDTAPVNQPTGTLYRVEVESTTALPPATDATDSEPPPPTGASTPSPTSSDRTIARAAPLRLQPARRGATDFLDDPGTTPQANSEHGDESTWQSNVPWSTGIGLRFNDDYFESRANAFAPLSMSLDGKHLLALDLSFGAFDEGDQNYSAGLAYRRYCESLAAILGFNVYYDHTQTQYGNGFQSLGLGLEYKGRLFDFNFGYCFPEEDLKDTGETAYGTPFAAGNSVFRPSFDRQEGAHQGGYIEGGINVSRFLPPELVEILGELRAYGGYYHYEDTDFGGGFDGPAARLEWRLNNFVALDAAWYQDEQFADSQWVAGVNFSIPIGIEKPLFSDAPNPGRTYSGSATPLGGGDNVALRMGERVYRKHRVPVSKSDESFAESFNSNQAVIGPGVNQPNAAPAFFANNGGAVGNGIGAGGMGGEDGSAEMPFDTIQEAVDAANTWSEANGAMPAYVYTQGGMDYASGAIFARESTHFVGTGKPLLGFGTGAAPVVNGSFFMFGLDVGPAGADPLDATSTFSIEGYTINNAGTGFATIDLINVADATVHDVVINNTGTADRGIAFSHNEPYAANLDVTWTTITGDNIPATGAGLGINVGAAGTGGPITVNTSMLTITDGGSGNGFQQGIFFNGTGTQMLSGTHSQTAIANTQGDALLLLGFNSSMGDHTFNGLDIDNAGDDAIDIAHFDMSKGTYHFNDVDIDGAGNRGVVFFGAGMGAIDFTGSDFEIRGVTNDSFFGLFFNSATADFTLNDFDSFSPGLSGLAAIANDSSAIDFISLNDFDIFTPTANAFFFNRAAATAAITVNSGGETSSNDTTGFPSGGGNRIESFTDANPITGSMILDGAPGTPIVDTP